jgi:hypothetical protein
MLHEATFTSHGCLRRRRRGPDQASPRRHSIPRSPARDQEGWRRAPCRRCVRPVSCRCPALSCPLPVRSCGVVVGPLCRFFPKEGRPVAKGTEQNRRTLHRGQWPVASEWADGQDRTGQHKRTPHTSSRGAHRGGQHEQIEQSSRRRGRISLPPLSRR